MARAVPSFALRLDEVVRPGVRLQLGCNHHPVKWVATVVRTSDDTVWLSVDEGDLAVAGLARGSAAILGLGTFDRAMLYVSDVTVREVTGEGLTVSFPVRARKAPRRITTRVPLAWPCRIDRGGGWLEATTLNVSASGVLLATEGQPALLEAVVGEEVSIRLEVADRGELAARATVVRLAAGPPGQPPVGVALHFADLPEVEEMRLQLAVLQGMARRYVRVHIERPCRLEVDRPGQDPVGPLVIDARSENLSGGGMLLRVRRSGDLGVGDRGALVAWLEDDRPLRIAPISVTRVDTGDDALVAVDYSGADRQVRTAIVEYVMGKLRDV